MRFHVVALPHTQTTAAFSACAYTWKVRGFCQMMKTLGHTVFLYAGEENEAPCDELITCIKKDEIAEVVAAAGHYTSAPFDAELPHWKLFNHRASNGIRRRMQAQDFVCIVGGLSHKPIADALPGITIVEFGIGYVGSFAKFRVFESYAWMHSTYARMTGWSTIVGNAYDDVVPGFVDMTKHPFSEKKDGPFLFVGRLTELKGFGIAVDVCKALGERLQIAGPGTPPVGPNIEYLGVLDEMRRGELMSRAKAVFVPSRYVEPFGMVHVEAMASGTPVITTDWGVFPETVINGFNGYRCRMLWEFVEAARNVDQLSPHAIRDHAKSHWSLEAVAPRFERYFERLQTLWGKGWYSGVDLNGPLKEAAE